MERAYEDVINRVNYVVPFFIEQTELKSKKSCFAYYNGLMDRFLGIVQSSESLFQATMDIMALRNQLLMMEDAVHKRLIHYAFDDIMEILKSTRKYYGVSNEILFKHDLVLQ
jgi:hypothetical protein